MNPNMRVPVTIVGLEADGPERLGPSARHALGSATWIAGGRRHLELIGPTRAETFTIGDNITALVARLSGRATDERCVVLATGDPLFYGIGHRLGQALGPDQIVVEPAVSSMQLAFARAGLAWHDAVIASIHGRPVAATLVPLLGKPKIGLFTQDGGSPAAIASFFHDRGLDDYTARVGERLGTPEERLTTAPLPDLIGQSFSNLNIVLLLRSPTDAPPIVTDSAFAQPEVGPALLTHSDIRALVVARFQTLPAGPLWDVGAGLGGVSVALARAFPEREVVAVERSPARLDFLRTNRARFAAYNVRVVAEDAPDCLRLEDQPAGTFLGGSGGNLDSILALVLDRLAPGGTLVADFVGIENLATTLDVLKRAGWPTDLTQAQIARGQPLAGLTTLAPLRPVWIVRAIRPQ